MSDRAPPRPPPRDDLRQDLHGDGSVRLTKLALFSAGFATFTLINGVQPLLPTLATALLISLIAAASSRTARLGDEPSARG